MIVTDSSQDSEALFRLWTGSVVQPNLPVLSLVRVGATLWTLAFITFFALCGHLDFTKSMVLQRQLTSSWLAPLYTGHNGIDVLMCLSGICLGRKVVTQWGGVGLLGLGSFLKLVKDRALRIYPAYALTSCAVMGLRTLGWPSPITTCSRELWYAELMMLQTSTPFEEQCCPWLWPVAIVFKATIAVAGGAALAHVVVLRLRAFARLHVRAALLFRRSRLSPGRVVRLFCAFGVVSCVLFRWNYYPLLFNHTITLFPHGMNMNLFNYYFATTRSRIAPFLVGVILSTHASCTAALTPLMKPMAAASFTLALGFLYLDVSELTVLTSSRQSDAFLAAVYPTSLALSVGYSIGYCGGIPVVRLAAQRAMSWRVVAWLHSLSYALLLTFPIVAAAGTSLVPPAEPVTPFSVLGYTVGLFPFGVVAALPVQLLLHRRQKADARMSPPASPTGTPPLGPTRHFIGGEQGGAATPVQPPAMFMSRLEQDSSDTGSSDEGSGSEDGSGVSSGDGESEGSGDGDGDGDQELDVDSDDDQDGSDDASSGDDSANDADMEELTRVADDIIAESQGTVGRGVNRALEYAEITGMPNERLVRLVNLVVDRSLVGQNL